MCAPAREPATRPVPPPGRAKKRLPRSAEARPSDLLPRLLEAVLPEILQGVPLQVYGPGKGRVLQ